MERKLINILLFFFVIRLVLYIPTIDDKYAVGTDDGSNIAFSGEINQNDIVDATVYPNLPIKNFYIDLLDDTDADNITWSAHGSNNYLFLSSAYDRNRIRVHFSDKPNVQVSAYDDKGNLLGVIKNDSYTDVFKENKVTLKTDINSKKVYTYKVVVMQSSVPSVSIKLDGGAKAFSQINASVNHNVKRAGNVVFADKDNIISTGMDEMRGRGNATWKRVKKPYQIKLDSKQDVFGMGKGKTWALITNTLDGTLSRNATFLEFGKKLGIDYSVDYQPVELYINGKYHGSYLLTEKVQVKKNRVDIDEKELLFEIENHPAGNDYVTTKRGLIVTIKNPDFDEISASERAEVKKKALAYLNKVENVIYGGSDEELRETIDYESFAKFYWLQEISENFDAIRGSNYFYTKDGKLYAGPGWDFDSTLNRSWAFGKQNEFYVLSNGLLQGRIRGNWYRALMKRTSFSNKVDQIYYDYNDQFESLDEFMSSYISNVKSSAKMNYVRWEFRTRVYYRDPIPGDDSLAGNINNLKNNLKNRLAFYRRQYSGMIYKDFVYKYTDSNGNEHEVPLYMHQVNRLPKDVGDSIKIYSGDKELKKIDTKDIGEVKLTYENKTGNAYKKYNRLTYTFNFERGA